MTGKKIAAAKKTSFGKADFDEILAEYDLGNHTFSQPFTSGAVQTNYLLETTTGKYAFKYYENRARKSVKFESSLIRYLNDKNYACPTPLKNKCGKYIGRYKKKPYSIFSYIAGEHLEALDEEQNKALIKKIAELHNITSNYKPAHKKQRWNYSKKLCKKLAKAEAKKINTRNAEKKLGWFCKELATLRLPKSLPKGVCHGDFHFSNVLYKNGQFKALIDFDDANYTWLIYDLAALINPFVTAFEWDSWQAFTDVENIFNFSAAKTTVSEYMKHRSLASVEKKHFFDVFKLSIMLDCIWRFERGATSEFFERRKIEYLNALGRKAFQRRLFS